MGEPLVGTLSSWLGTGGINGSLAYKVRIRLGVRLDPRTHNSIVRGLSLQLSMLLSSGFMSDPHSSLLVERAPLP